MRRHLILAILLIPSLAFAGAKTIGPTSVDSIKQIGPTSIESFKQVGDTEVSTTPADQTLRPSADSGSAWSLSGGSTRWELVDETVSDDDTTYIYRADSDAVQAFSNLPTLPTGTILGVSVHYVGKEQTGSTSGYARIVVGGNSSSDSSDGMESAYAEYSHEWTVNPETSSAWLKADVEGTGSDPLQTWGFGSGIGAGEEMRVTQVWLVVRYN